MSAPAVLPGPFLKRSLKSSIMETGRITFNFTQSSYAFAEIYSKGCSDIFQYLVIIVKQIIFAQKIILAVRFEIVAAKLWRSHGDQSGTGDPSGKENFTSDERTACVLNG